MKKLSSTLPNMAIVLTLISVIAGGLLAYVNSVTEGPIAKINEENLQAGIKKVLCSDDAKVEKCDSVKDEKGALAAIVYSTDKGVAVQATDHNGFGGDLTVLVGFDANGSIKGYTILQSSETPGLGAKAGEWFQQDQGGKHSSVIGKNPGEGELTVSKDGGQIDAITASTITSRAFLRAVNEAYKQFKGGNDCSTGASCQQKNMPAAADTTTMDTITNN